jgi:oligosaccharyltransferase complex subunit alpha (ribophorin I)
MKKNILSNPIKNINGNITSFSVKLDAIDSKDKIDPLTLSIETVFTNILIPYPAEIKQLDNQYIKASDTLYFFSPYPTNVQKTVIKLPENQDKVESYTKHPPSSLKGKVLTYGPYNDVKPYDDTKMSVHYMNHNKFAKFSTVSREVEVSHWGNVAFEDVYELKHFGAKLKGGFSRFDYQMRRQGQQQTHSFRNLIAKLPSKANNIYYRDQIGNISTSDIRDYGDQMELEIETRFPLFGGWQTQFYIGYSLPTESTLSVLDDGRLRLSFDFFPIFEEVFIDEMEIKVILPEGSSNIEVNVPYKVEQERTTRYTYLDSKVNGGRPVITLKAKNIVEEHDEPVTITYKFSNSRMIVEPLMLIVFYFSFFLICIVFARIDTGITKKEKKE